MRRAKSDSSSPKARPATSPDAREKQLMCYAMDLAEKQLRDGTASSQTINHFLKLATMQTRLECEKLEQENELLRAKTDAIQSEKRTEELYETAVKAMRKYSGSEEYDDEDIY